VLRAVLVLYMVSEVKYPTFKSLDLKATRTFTRTLIAIRFWRRGDRKYDFVLPVLFTVPHYGFIRRSARQDAASHRGRELEKKTTALKV